MNDIPISLLLAVLLILILLSAFFSGSETALMTLNRYRLRNRLESGDRAALRIDQLLQRPDRVLGVILLGNNFVNILASALATVIALRLFGEAGIAIATGSLTLVILIFAELAPKTLAAAHPERLAYPASLALSPLLRLAYPLVWLINAIANRLLSALGVNLQQGHEHRLTVDELGTVVRNAGALRHTGHLSMTLNLMELERATVEDIMIQRGEIEGLDMADDAEQLRRDIETTLYSWLPVYRGSIDQTFGMVRTRRALPLVQNAEFNRDSLAKVVEAPYFIPEGTDLIRQMVNFRKEKRRVGLVVSEYGDIQGMVTLTDIFEEVVGEFATDPWDIAAAVTPEQDGGYLLDAMMSVRAVNRALNWTLPLDGPKTLNGLILEHMETIPTADTSLKLHGYPIEIVQTTTTGVRTVRAHPTPQPPPADEPPGR